MSKFLKSLMLFLLPVSSTAQDDVFVVNDFTFELRREILDNEWNSKDTLLKLYRKEDNKSTYVLKFYEFKDEGGDCNNVYWYKEALSVEGNNLVFVTQYFQKTGLDPIPTYRKQVYALNSEGKLLLKFDKYKYANSTEWVDE